MTQTDMDVTLTNKSNFLNRSRWINENQDAVAIRDEYPVSPGHTLIVPKKVVSSIFDLSDTELLSCWWLLKAERSRLQAELSPDGFNIGVNVGEAAGQTVSRAHIHLIPRFKGDHPSPRGGVRCVIQGKARY